MDLGDPGTTSDPLRLFCARLRRLQAQSGIKQAGLLGAAGLKRSQVSDILNGKIERPPDWGVTIALVRACLKHAKADGRLVPPDLSDEADWQRRYFDLEQDLDTGARAKPRHQESAGRLLAEVTDPFALEVHHPAQPDGSPAGLPALPTYVPRPHDQRLTEVVRAVIGGSSAIAVLVGGSSTGKTRACWEALDPLREQPAPWRLWHPIDPGRPEAALRELPSIGPRTRHLAERGPVLPRRARWRPGRTGRCRATGTAARPRPRACPGAGHALASVLGHPNRPPGRG